MSQVRDRLVPDDPHRRLGAALAAATAGVPALVYGVFALTWPVQQWLYFGHVASVTVLLVGVVALLSARALARDVSGRVEDADPGSRSADSGGTGEDAVATLKRRYAAGELTEAEFERKLERLVALDATDGRDDAGTDDLLVETE